MKKVFALVASTLLAGVSAVHAQGIYGDVAYQMIDAGVSKDPAAIRLIGGYEINNTFALEGMLGFGIKKGKDTVLGGTDVSLKLKELWGVYVKPSFKLNDTAVLYGRVGYAGIKTSATASANGKSFSASASDSDFSYGVGMSYTFMPKLSGFVDYMKYGDADGFAVGLGYKF